VNSWRKLSAVYEYDRNVKNILVRVWGDSTVRETMSHIDLNFTFLLFVCLYLGTTVDGGANINNLISYVKVVLPPELFSYLTIPMHNGHMGLINVQWHLVLQTGDYTGKDDVRDK
jgi:hypothetical protein